MNAIIGRRWSLSLAYDDNDDDCELIDISFGDEPPLRTILPQLDITISSSFGCFVLSFELDLCNALSDITLAGWREESLGVLDATWRAVLILTRLAQTAGLDDALESIDGVVRCTKASSSPPFSSLRGTIRVQDELLAFDLAFLSVPAAAFGWFTTFASDPLPVRFDPGFSCILRLPPRTLDIDDYAKLDINDFLLIAVTAGNALSVTGDIPGILRFAGDLYADGSVHVLQADLEMEAFETAETTDVQPEIQSMTDVPLFGEDAISALPIKIDVLLKTRQLSLAELRTLGPGYTLDLQIDLAAPVTILANGTAIGSGYLLQLGDHLGVQIARWPTRKVPSDA